MIRSRSCYVTSNVRIHFQIGLGQALLGLFINQPRRNLQRGRCQRFPSFLQHAPRWHDERNRLSRNLDQHTSFDAKLYPRSRNFRRRMDAVGFGHPKRSRSWNPSLSQSFELVRGSLGIGKGCQTELRRHRICWSFSGSPRRLGEGLHVSFILILIEFY